MRERRKISRWQINKPAKIKLEGTEVFIDCLLKDINFKGMQIALGAMLKVDNYVKFTLVLSEGCALECVAWVAWYKSIDTRNIYALYFIKLTDTDKEKIYKFIHQNVPEVISRAWWKDTLKEEGGDDMEDHRIFQRFNIRFPVRLLNLNSGQEITAETSDISAKGMGLKLNQSIEARTPLEAWLKIPDRGGPFYTRGNVVWVKSEGVNNYSLGVELEKADLMGVSRILRN